VLIETLEKYQELFKVIEEKGYSSCLKELNEAQRGIA